MLSSRFGNAIAIGGNTGTTVIGAVIIIVGTIIARTIMAATTGILIIRATIGAPASGFISDSKI
jgi:hypothetical protein